MTNGHPDEHAAENQETLPDALALTEALGMILNNTLKGYWFSERDRLQSIEDFSNHVRKALKETQRIVYRAVADELKVNGEEMDLTRMLIRAVEACLTSLEATNITLHQGVTNEEVATLIKILTRQPAVVAEAGGVGPSLKEAGVEHIESKVVIYREISQEEVVVAKDKLTKLGPTEKAREDVERILDYLKSDVPALEHEHLQSVHDLAADSEKMADLLLRAAKSKQDSAAGESTGEDLGKLVVGSLQRTYEGLSKDPAFQTQKGRKTLSRTLSMLKDEMLKSMQGTDDFDDEHVAAVAHAAEKMEQEIKMDSLAAEYAKKRKAIEESEQRLLSFIRATGLDQVDEAALRQKLAEVGLNQAVWQGLVDKQIAAGDRADEPNEDAEARAMGHLAILLDHLEQGISELGAGGTKADDEAALPAETLTEVLSEVDREVQGIMAGTQQKIHDLVESVHADEEATKIAEEAAKRTGQGPKMSRSRMLEVLAEIVQELCQPLAVINCSLDMLSKGPGSEQEPHNSLMELALQSSARIQTLIDNLQEISGVPDTMSPDAGIITSLYER